MRTACCGQAGGGDSAVVCAAAANSRMRNSAAMFQDSCLPASEGDGCLNMFKSTSDVQFYELADADLSL